MLQGFTWDRGAWRGGRLLNPEDGRMYSGEVRPDGDMLRLQGCAALVFCKSQVWRRLNSIPRPDAASSNTSAAKLKAE
jgi:uncharacterized protein (DUF2147 family)